jgi:hypothetical protein
MNRLAFIPFLVLMGVITILAAGESLRKRDAGIKPDGCRACHEPAEDPSSSHPVSVLGCAICHLGNPYAREKQRAHLGLITNPGDLRTVRLTCGREGCHEELPDRIEKSLMATNRGILTALQSFWPHEPEESVQDVTELLSIPSGKSMALDHYRKMCGGCHLWKSRDPSRGEIGRRGGGCTDCHLLELSNPTQNLARKPFRHPQLTTRIPNENCLKCHHRSSRIGLSYHGYFESEGYATPFEDGDHSSRRLTGGRFYLELEPDVHFAKAGLDCIDCHTEKGLMGDGNTYTHMEEQIDITCNACHDPEVKEPGPEKHLADRLWRLNMHQPSPEPKEIILSPGGSPLYHLRPITGEEFQLCRKRDGKTFNFKRLGHQEVHKAPFHGRLTCQACHSAWIPQCYGCHVALLQGEEQADWLTGRISPGRWVEGRSYLRFSRPALGIWPNGMIGPFAPGCQVFLDVFDPEGRHQPELSHHSLVMASFDPHTTVLTPVSCVSCHGNPRSLGLGDGSLKITARGFQFVPRYNSRASGLGMDFPLDAFVSPDGKAQQKASRKGARPFNLEELNRISRVCLCLPCHDTYHDPIYLNYEQSLKQFQSNRTPCKRGLP